MVGKLGRGGVPFAARTYSARTARVAARRSRWWPASANDTLEASCGVLGGRREQFGGRCYMLSFAFRGLYGGSVHPSDSKQQFE